MRFVDLGGQGLLDAHTGGVLCHLLLYLDVPSLETESG